MNLPKSAVNVPVRYAANIRRMVDRLVGIPVSVGLAPTKTLAKLASERAKKTEAGVLEITEGNRPEILANTSVGDVWGIGPKASEKLTRRGMSEAADFTNMNPVNVKKLFSFCGNDSQFNILQDYE